MKRDDSAVDVAALFRSLFDQAPIGFAILDADLRYRRVNEQLAQMHGVPAAAHVGVRPEAIVPDIWPKIESQYHAVLAGHGVQDFIVSGSPRLDGRGARVLEVRLVPLPSREAPTAIACFVHDTTERERVRDEEWRQRYKMDALGRVASGIAHDFGNLLTVVDSCSELLLDSLPNDCEARELAEEIRQAGERGGALTRQLLSFARKDSAAPKACDLNDVLDEHEQLLRRLIDDDIVLTLRLERPLWPVFADAGLVVQMLINLAANARDAMPGGGRLVITTHAATITHGDADVRPGEWVVLTVRDTGLGIDESVRSRIFDPFFTTKPAGRGTGIGLATVRWAVEESKGVITVQSELNRGTTFRIYFPRVTASVPAPTRVPAIPLPSAMRGTETVLVVEDEAHVRMLARRILENFGYTVLEAADGSEALNVARRHDGTIPLVISDVVMPHLGGLAFSEALHQERPESRFLYVTGYDEEVMVQHGIVSSREDLLMKPFTPLALAQRVRAALDLRIHS